MHAEDNGNTTRGGVTGFVGRVWSGIKNFFVASWAYLVSSHATFSILGDQLIASGQTDLLNLKSKLEHLWEITDEDKQTTALYLAAILGKFGFTFIIISVSLIASLVKLTVGSCCLLLAGRWLTLFSKLFNTLRELFVQTAIFIKDMLKNIITNALKLFNKLLRKLANYLGKFLNAVLDFLRALSSYLNSAWKMVLDVITAITRRFVSVARVIGNGLLNVWRFTLDFAAAARRAIWSCIKAVARFTNKFLRNLGNAILNCLKGFGHLALGTLKAGSIVAKGIVLSVAALFIETGIARSLSGVAKTLFILDESLAAGLGALLDGFYASGNSFIKAFKSLFGYSATIPEAIPAQGTTNLDAPVATETDDFETESEASNGVALDDGRYFSNALRNNMHYVNEGVVSVGNQLLSVYQRQRDSMIGTSGWSQVDEFETPGSTPRYRHTISNG
jgi:hypothetical protein